MMVMLAACATGGDAPVEDVETAAAPLVGVDGSHDQADRACNVVLRDLTRTGTSPTSDAYVWTGTVEISSAAAAEGLVPSVIYQYGSNPAWFAATVTPVTGPGSATPGYARFAVQIDHDVLGPGMSATAHQRARIQVEPFLPLAGGGRLFDHNRNPGDFDNYVLSSPSFAIARADQTCAPPVSSQHANLVFQSDFTQHRDGVIAAGGTMTILYDNARLSQCVYTQGGQDRYDISAHVKWLPAGQESIVSVRHAPATVPVPTDGAQQVAVWFETTSISGCHQWDSNYGANYVFDLARAPQWIGNAVNRLTRDTSDPCAGGVPAASGATFDTWVRQRAAITNLCFEVYQPGVTDRDNPDLWQQLDAAVRWHVVGDPGPWHLAAAPLASTGARVGNNARYAVSWRPIDPFQPYTCPSVKPTPTADGQYVQLPVEYVIVVNGGELRPAPGAAFVTTFVDYPNASCP